MNVSIVSLPPKYKYNGIHINVWKLEKIIETSNWGKNTSPNPYCLEPTYAPLVVNKGLSK